MIVLVALGEDAHADLVEGGSAQRGERLLLNGFGLMNPGIRGGAEGKERRAVRIGEMIIVTDGDRTMDVGESGCAGEGSAAFIESRSIACRDVAPRTGGVGHEADFVRARAVVEAIYINGAVAE